MDRANEPERDSERSAEVQNDAQTLDDVPLEEVAHLERLAVVGQLCAEMAHEISQPLTAIRMFADTALGKIKEPTAENLSQVEEALATIYVQAARLQQLTSRVHGVSCPSQQTRQPVAISDVLDNVLPLVEPLAERYGVEFELDVPQPSPRLVADRVQLEQVMLNLVRNAVEAVALQPPERRRVLIRVVPERESIAIDVVDRGEGISESNLPHVFDRYFTTREGGVGLGLYIVREIVRSHGGTIAVRPNPDAGVTFHVEWPAAAP